MQNPVIKLHHENAITSVFEEMSKAIFIIIIIIYYQNISSGNYNASKLNNNAVYVFGQSLYTV